MSLLRYCGRLLMASILTLAGCTTGTEFVIFDTNEDSQADDPGGGQGGDQGGAMFTIQLPFAMGVEKMCTQGANGVHSHQAVSTLFDIDLDTDNYSDEEIFAPVSGIARVHFTPTWGFGIHVNIDLGNGLYVVIAHLKEVFVLDGQEVTAGQLLGFEGRTGDSTGDHVHIGLHRGDAGRTADHGVSVPAFYRAANQSQDGLMATIASEDFACGIRSEGDPRDGDTYESDLAVNLWHPDGTLVKTPDNARVYLLQDGGKRWIENESVFWEMELSFGEVVLISSKEFDCLGIGQDIVSPIALPEYGGLREGDLVKETDASDVYAVADGRALPIKTWDVFLLMWFGNRTIKELPPGAVEDALQMGNCAADVWCLDFEAVTTCGGGLELGDGPGTGGDPGGDDVVPDDDDTVDDDDDVVTDDDDSTPPASDDDDTQPELPDDDDATDDDDDDMVVDDDDATPELQDDDDDATPPPASDDDDATDEEPAVSTLNVEVDYPANYPELTLTVQPVFEQSQLGQGWHPVQPSVLGDDEVAWSQEGSYENLLGVRFNVNVDTDGNGVNDDWYCYGHYASAFLEYGVAVDITLGDDSWDENDLVTWSPGTVSQTELGCSALLWFGNTNAITVGFVQ